MLLYLNIILDDSSVSYCHYESGKKPRLILLQHLMDGIRFAMMENLMIQFVYPDYELPPNYIETIESIDHFNIRHSPMEAEISIVDNWDFTDTDANTPILLRTTKQDLFDKWQQLLPIIPQVIRLNIVVTDIWTFHEEDYDTYRKIIQAFREEIERKYINDVEHLPQINLLTDRLVLYNMNNCGAGIMNITLAPNGKFYVCPAFYYEDEAYSIGDLEHGLDIKNRQLYKLENAPICRHCDAYQCKRCVWLNRKMTLEVNTPSHEQCVLAHIERSASRELLQNLRKKGEFLPDQEIKEIDYLDPFDKRNEWQ